MFAKVEGCENQQCNRIRHVNSEQSNTRVLQQCPGCNQEYCACGNQSEVPFWPTYDSDWIQYPSHRNYWESDRVEEQNPERTEYTHSKGYSYHNTFQQHTSGGNTFIPVSQSTGSPEAFLPSDIFNLESSQRFSASMDNQCQYLEQYYVPQSNNIQDDIPYVNNATTGDEPSMDPLGRFLYPCLPSHVNQENYQGQPTSCPSQSIYSGHHVLNSQEYLEQYVPIQQLSNGNEEFWLNSYRPLLN